MHNRELYRCCRPNECLCKGDRISACGVMAWALLVSYELSLHS